MFDVLYGNYVMIYCYWGCNIYGRDRKDSVVWDFGGDVIEFERVDDVIYSGRKEIWKCE